MRNPYITGPYVSGRKHYGRQELVDYLLHGAGHAYWVIGNHGIGKTSLLRHLEATALEDGRLIPFYWDMQGSENFVRMSEYLTDAAAEHRDRLTMLGFEPGKVSSPDAATFLGAIRRAAKRADREVLLLCDEPEALIRIAQRAPKSAQRLHRELTAGAGLRVVIASTQAVYQLHDVCAEWTTSRFLSGFDISQTLGSLSPRSARSLIVQEQEPECVRAAPDVLEAVCDLTNCHPYLLQVLCARLFQDTGTLRRPAPADLDPDPALRSMFSSDVGSLSKREREIMRVVRGSAPADEAGLLAKVGGSAAQLGLEVRNLERLGFLRHCDGALALGNAFLASWLAVEPGALEGAPNMTDSALQTALESRQAQEVSYLQARLNARRTRLVELEVVRARDLLGVSPAVLAEIEQVQEQIDHLRLMLEEMA